jgi:enamine deaminase RidA (YjgF/YER057c/UK114 family)
VSDVESESESVAVGLAAAVVSGPVLVELEALALVVLGPVLEDVAVAVAPVVAEPLPIDAVPVAELVPPPLVAVIAVVSPPLSDPASLALSVAEPPSNPMPNAGLSRVQPGLRSTSPKAARRTRGTVVTLPARPRPRTGARHTSLARRGRAMLAAMSPPRPDSAPVHSDSAPSPHGDAAGPHRAIQPAGWPAPRGYANGMVAPNGWLAVAGQIGWDTSGRIVDGGFAAQFDQALRNVVDVVRAAGGEPHHLLSLTIYVTDKAAYTAALAEVGRSYRAIVGRHFPAMALVEVRGLLEPGAEVEIQAIAVVPPQPPA